MKIEFFVAGIPAPGGSKKAFVPRRKDGSFVMRPGGKSPMINVTDDGKRNKQWRRMVAAEAKARFGLSEVNPGPTTRPLACSFRFYMPRPKNHFRANGELHKWAPARPTTKPDALKLARSTEDALTGIIWVDDSQVVDGAQSKFYAGAGYPAGCKIIIESVDTFPL